MALVFMDGFSHYQTSDIIRKWTAKSDTACVWAIMSAEGRTAGCIKRTSTSNSGSGQLTKGPTIRQNSVWTPQNAGVCGFALKIDDLSRLAGGGGIPASNTLSGCLLAVWHGNVAQFGIVLNDDGTLSVKLSAGVVSNGETVATTINVITSNSWAYLEFKWLIHGTTGNLVIKANGIEVLNYTGRLMPNTYPYSSPPALWTSITFLGLPSATSPFLIARACDFYLLDTTGATNNDFLGDVSIKYIRPDEVGVTTGWTPTPAVANWENVNEVPGNDDTDYNATTAPGTIDLYGFEPLGVNPIALQHCILARRTIPGSATLQSVAKPLGANFLSPEQAVRNETYEYNLFPYDTNPATGIRWTQAEVDAGQFGVNKAT